MMSEENKIPKSDEQNQESESIERDAQSLSGDHIPHEDQETESGPGEAERDYDLAEIIFSTLKTLAPNWDVTEEESSQLSVVYCRLLDKYKPGWRDESIETMAVLVTAQVALPRIGMPRKIKDVTPKKPDAASGQDKVDIEDKKPTGKKQRAAKG